MKDVKIGSKYKIEGNIYVIKRINDGIYSLEYENKILMIHVEKLRSEIKNGNIKEL